NRRKIYCAVIGAVGMLAGLSLLMINPYKPKPIVEPTAGPRDAAAQIEKQSYAGSMPITGIAALPEGALVVSSNAGHFPTIAAALASAKAGDRILVTDRTHDEA